MATRAQIEDLIARTALRDREAFAALYDATQATLFGICLRVLKDRTDAEDALQDVYVRIWQKAGTYAVTGHSPMTWLITLARNQAIDRLRARKPAATEAAAPERVPDTQPGPEAAAVMASEARRIALCMDELPPDRADAVRGAYLDGETYQTLAARHGVPLNTMRTWLRRSLAKLRECLSR